MVLTIIAWKVIILSPRPTQAKRDKSAMGETVGWKSVILGHLPHATKTVFAPLCACCASRLCSHWICSTSAAWLWRGAYFLAFYPPINTFNIQNFEKFSIVITLSNFFLMLTKPWIFILCTWVLFGGGVLSQTPVEVVNKTFKLAPHIDSSSIEKRRKSARGKIFTNEQSKIGKNRNRVTTNSP